MKRSMKSPFSLWKRNPDLTDKERATFIYAPEPFISSGGFGSIHNNGRVLGRWWGDNKLMVSFIRRATYEAPLLQSYLRIMRTQVVGRYGIRPTFSSVTNNEHREIIAKKWKDFARQASTTGKESLAELQGATVETVATDGRMLAVVRKDKRYPGGVAVQLVARDYMATGENTAQRADGYVLHQGVEYNDIGQIVAYHFNKDLEPDQNTFSSGIWRIFSVFGSAVNRQSKTERVLSDQVMDIRKVRHADDVDGDVSWLLPAVFAIRAVADFDAATIGAMQEAARKFGFITNSVESPGNRDDAITRSRLGLDEEQELSTENQLASTVFHGEEFRSWGNTLTELYKGQQFQSFDPTYPQQKATEFRKEVYRTACAGLGVDYHSVNSDAEGVNFSSLRHFALQTRDTYYEIQQMLVDRMMYPLLQHFVDWHSNSDVRGVSQKSWDQARETTFRARTFQWVDPSKDTQQNETLVNMGAKSIKMVAEELGIDIQDVLDDGVELAAALEKAGPEKIQLIMSIFGKAAKATDTAGENTGNGENSDESDNESGANEADERAEDAEQTRVVEVTSA